MTEFTVCIILLHHPFLYFITI